LTADPLDAGNELLLLFFQMRHIFLDYILGGYGKQSEAAVVPPENKNNVMSIDSAQEPPSTRRAFLCCDERSENRL
jgi:hypothetical protein